MPFLYCYYPIYTLCNHCLSQCDTTLRLCRYLLWITVHEVMVPVRFPCATLLQTHDHDDTLTFNICSATTAGALDKLFNSTWTTLNSLLTRTLTGNANSSDSRLIYQQLSQHAQLGRHPSTVRAAIADVKWGRTKHQKAGTIMPCKVNIRNPHESIYLRQIPEH